MNGVEFYYKIKELFTGKNIIFGLYVNPLYNINELDKRTQYVSKDGQVIPPWNSKAQEFLIPDPLMGSFYNLPIKEISIGRLQGEYANDKEVAIQIGVEKADKQICFSMPIYIECGIIYALSLIKNIFNGCKVIREVNGRYMIKLTVIKEKQLVLPKS
jgi:hypothetical protein